jgi:hypothetical protein
MLYLSRPAMLATILVVIATVGFEITAIAVYRDSSDGQSSVLWMFIVIYGLLAVGAIKLIDSAVRRVRKRTPRRGPSGNI